MLPPLNHQQPKHSLLVRKLVEQALLQSLQISLVTDLYLLMLAFTTNEEQIPREGYEGPPQAGSLAKPKTEGDSRSPEQPDPLAVLQDAVTSTKQLNTGSFNQVGWRGQRGPNDSAGAQRRGLERSPLSVTGPASLVTSCGRRIRLPRGHARDSQQYDGASRVIEVNENGAMVAQYAYDANGNKTMVTDGNKHATKYTYDPEGRVLTSTDALQQISTVRYDRSGNPMLTRDSEGNQQSSSYDELGRLISETNAWGRTQSISYDAWSNPTHRVDAQGTNWQLTYDPTGQLLSETGILGSKTFQRSYTYDEAGDRKSATDNGITTTYNTVGGSYKPDPYGLLRSKSLTVENTTLTMGYQYDQRQRLTTVTYPDASSVSYQYNQTNQIVGMPGWLSGSIGYNEAALLSNYTAANGLTTKINYDDRNRISTMGYSASGIDLKNYQLTYDKAGNIITKNQNIYGYDELNRLIGANERGSFQQEPQDVTPKVAALDSDYEPEVGVLDFTASYQAQDLVKLDLGSRSLGLDLGHEYGINQLRITPAAGQTIHRVREKDLSVWASVDNQQFTKVTGWKFSQDNGVLLIRLASTIQARYLKINTIWDDRDIDDGIVDAATVSNQASAIVQVWTQVTSQNTTYQYDAAGNRTSLSVTRDGSTKTSGSLYYHNSTGGNLSWLASDGAWYYQYDDSGNLVTKAKQATIDLNSRSFVLDATKEYWNYAWDLKNRLSSVSKNSALVVSYRYDADNLRVSRTKDNQTKVYAYGRGGAIAYVKDITANTSRTYTYLDSIPIGWTDNAADGTSSRYYAVTDHLGSVTQVTDSNAKVVWSSEYDPFGKTSGVEGLYDFDGSYAGHEVDADTGLIYMWNRWQDPETGRFVSEDPARAGINWYRYAKNNPLRWTDPTGLMTPEESARYYAGQAGYNLDVSDSGITSSSNSSNKSAGSPPQPPIDPKVLVILAQDVYGGKDLQELPGTWKRVSDEQLAAAAAAANLDPKILTEQLTDDRSGFQSALYTNGSGQYVYAFAGTQDEKDIQTDLRQTMGGETRQYNLAMSNTEMLAQIYGTDNLTLTGHSLGGGLATAASAVTGVPAVTFNPAVVNEKTILRQLRSEGNQNTTWASIQENLKNTVTNYVIPGEMLNNLGFGSSLGKTVMLNTAGYVDPVISYQQSSNALMMNLGALDRAVTAHSNWKAYQSALSLGGY